MKPPRSVWVVVSPTYGPVEAYPFREKPDADEAGWPGATVVRYVLPPKRKARKGERRVR